MKRLAADVTYLNGLQRLIADGVRRADAVEMIEMQCTTLLPTARASSFCQAIHETNVETMIAATVG